MTDFQPKQNGVDTQDNLSIDILPGVVVRLSVNAYKRAGAVYQLDVAQCIPTPIISRYVGRDDFNKVVDFDALPIPWQLDISLANSGQKIPAYITTRPLTDSLTSASQIVWEFNSNYGGEGASIRGGEIKVDLVPRQTTKISTGRTSPNDWQDYDNTTHNAAGIYVDVDTSSAEFLSVPNYHVSLCGHSTHWKVSGVNSVYKESKNGFRVYLCWSDNDGPFQPNAINPLRAELARNNEWFLRWTGVEQS